jgi:arylsulfatase A-like enzyme
MTNTLRRKLLVAAGVTALVAAGVAVEVAARPGHQPNLILIVTDDQRADTLFAMPNVERLLGQHGVTFDNAFVTTSLCCPSRASILTGQLSRHTGVYNDVPPMGGAPAFHDRSTLATWLHDTGYRTALIGKYLNDYSSLPPGYVPPGWDEWDAIQQEPVTRYYDYTLSENGRTERFGRAPADYSTNILGALARRFVRTARPPFFLYFAPIAPHVPAVPAHRDVRSFAGREAVRGVSFDERDISDKPWSGTYGRAIGPRLGGVYDHVREHMLESLQAVDRAVATIVAGLAARGQLDDTVIAYTSDNGYLLGEHRLLGKVWPYSESIRVPLVFRLPGQAAAGRVDRHLALNIDLAPTLAELAGVSPSLPEDGRSLVALLEGRVVPWRNAFLEEFLGRQLVPNIPPPFEAVRTERYLYVEYRNGWRELYDLRVDPFELSNVAADPRFAAARTALQALLRRLTAR